VALVPWMRTLTVSLYFIHVGLQAQFIMGRNKECFVCSCVAAISQSLGVFAPARTPSSHTQLRRGGSSPTRSCYKNHQHTTAADAAERDAAELSLLFLFFGKGALLLSLSLSLSLFLWRASIASELDLVLCVCFFPSPRPLPVQ
jgi:hypothetical protein